MLQAKDDQIGDYDYAILSSYLAPIVVEGSASYGTLEEHILAACVSTSSEELSASIQSTGQYHNFKELLKQSSRSEVATAISSWNFEERYYVKDREWHGYGIPTWVMGVGVGITSYTNAIPYPMETLVGIVLHISGMFNNTCMDVTVGFSNICLAH
ncbi:hypothetical protein BU15DRAFT_58845 [Melanogaster broomeanus]|nr:hypothetical protein BU15DRAFT_58845 [Melanogaster broomeanus]